MQVSDELGNIVEHLEADCFPIGGGGDPQGAEYRTRSPEMRPQITAIHSMY